MCSCAHLGFGMRVSETAPGGGGPSKSHPIGWGWGQTPRKVRWGSRGGGLTPRKVIWGSGCGVQTPQVDPLRIPGQLGAGGSDPKEG
jgi:hypothetical protein